jgi:hypothetical protein
LGRQLPVAGPSARQLVTELAVLEWKAGTAGESLGVRTALLDHQALGDWGLHLGRVTNVFLKRHLMPWLFHKLLAGTGLVPWASLGLRAAGLRYRIYLESQILLTLILGAAMRKICIGFFRLLKTSTPRLVWLVDYGFTSFADCGGTLLVPDGQIVVAEDLRIHRRLAVSSTHHTTLVISIIFIGSVLLYFLWRII